ncbi:hypothetical protein Nepgr_013702 [Nepenthes gracilis]|uniref:Uncharacterized protein n=1 Tax=Nepenthes gracilis TaxID=150966 RepID=A0AAD3SK83_NEPGR|nr:hypothetical protein Nepgr_013702 [Nepenthes gracilis]
MVRVRPNLPHNLRATDSAGKGCFFSMTYPITVFFRKLAPRTDTSGGGRTKIFSSSTVGNRAANHGNPTGLALPQPYPPIIYGLKRRYRWNIGKAAGRRSFLGMLDTNCFEATPWLNF